MSGTKPKKTVGAKETRDSRPCDRDELETDRRSLPPFTNAEVLARWKRIRDGALCLTEKLIADTEGAYVPKFLSSIVDTIQQAQAEINGLERMLGINIEPVTNEDEPLEYMFNTPSPAELRRLAEAIEAAEKAKQCRSN